MSNTFQREAHFIAITRDHMYTVHDHFTTIWHTYVHLQCNWESPTLAWMTNVQHPNNKYTADKQTK